MILFPAGAHLGIASSLFGVRGYSVISVEPIFASLVRLTAARNGVTNRVSIWPFAAAPIMGKEGNSTKKIENVMEAWKPQNFVTENMIATFDLVCFFNFFTSFF